MINRSGSPSPHRRRRPRAVDQRRRVRRKPAHLPGRRRKRDPDGHRGRADGDGRHERVRARAGSSPRRSRTSCSAEADVFPPTPNPVAPPVSPVVPNPTAPVSTTPGRPSPRQRCRRRCSDHRSGDDHDHDAPAAARCPPRRSGRRSRAPVMTRLDTRLVRRSARAANEFAKGTRPGLKVPAGSE
jgi:hypothetical protein